MCKSDQIPSSSIKITYYDNNSNEVNKNCAFHKITTYTDSAGNIIKLSKQTRFSLNQDW
jgi:hypothetical protein